MNVKPKRKSSLDDSHLNQIIILKSICALTFSKSTADISAGCQINEIAARSGLKDEKEVLRYLFILEGQKLVAPCPDGDFTSKYWKITKDGVEAVRSIERIPAN